MKRFVLVLTILIAALTFTATTADAQGRRDDRGRRGNSSRQYRDNRRPPVQRYNRRPNYRPDYRYRQYDYRGRSGWGIYVDPGYRYRGPYGYPCDPRFDWNCGPYYGYPGRPGIIIEIPGRRGW